VERSEVAGRPRTPVADRVLVDAPWNDFRRAAFELPFGAKIHSVAQRFSGVVIGQLLPTRSAHVDALIGDVVHACEVHPHFVHEAKHANAFRYTVALRKSVFEHFGRRPTLRVIEVVHRQWIVVWTTKSARFIVLLPTEVAVVSMFYPRNILYHTASWFEAMFHVDCLVPHDCARRSGGGGESGGVEWPHVAEDTFSLGFSAVWWWKSYPADSFVVILVRIYISVPFQPILLMADRSWVGAISREDFLVSGRL
jgi:hypothetical protein